MLVFKQKNEFVLINPTQWLFYRPSRGAVDEQQAASAAATGESRFAYSLLEKLIQYTDKASINMKLLKPSSTFSRRSSFKTCSRDIKFFSKVGVYDFFFPLTYSYAFSIPYWFLNQLK